MPTDHSLDPLGREDLLRGRLAASPRTLIDIFRDTVSAHPDAPAVDNGAERLTYEELAEAADELAADLHARGIGRGDRVGVRVRSGTTTLYVAILGTLAAGAAYVPVDADDPDDRARLVFGEAGTAAAPGRRRETVRSLPITAAVPASPNTRRARSSGSSASTGT